MKLKPLGDRLIVQAIEDEQASVSGLVLPDTAKEKPQKGEVIAVGVGKLDENGKRIPLEVEEGDEILYSKYGGTEIKIQGEDLLVLRESDVLANVNETEHHIPTPAASIGPPSTISATLHQQTPSNRTVEQEDDEDASLEPDEKVDLLRLTEDKARARVQQGLTRLRELAR